MKAPDPSKKRQEGRRIEVAGGGGGHHLLLLGGALVAAILGAAALRTHAIKRIKPATRNGDELTIKGEGREANSVSSTGNSVSQEMEEGLRSLLQSPPAPPPLWVSHHHRQEVPVDFEGLKSQQENYSEITVTTTCGNSDLLPSSDPAENHHPNDARDHMLSTIIDKDVIVHESKVAQVQKKVVDEEQTSTEEDDEKEEESTEEGEVTEDESDGTGDSSMESNADAVWPAETIETPPSMDTPKLDIQSEVRGGEENELELPPKGSGEKIGREVVVGKGTAYKALAGSKSLNHTRGLFFFFLAFTLVSTMVVHWFCHHHLNVFKS